MSYGALHPVVDELLTSWRLGIDKVYPRRFLYVEEYVRVSQELLPRLRAAMVQDEPNIEHAKS